MIRKLLLWIAVFSISLSSANAAPGNHLDEHVVDKATNCHPLGFMLGEWTGETVWFANEENRRQQYLIKERVTLVPNTDSVRMEAVTFFMNGSFHRRQVSVISQDNVLGEWQIERLVSPASHVQPLSDGYEMTQYVKHGSDSFVRYYGKFEGNKWTSYANWHPEGEPSSGEVTYTHEMTRIGKAPEVQCNLPIG